jgi:hypothetical protein
VNSSGDIDGVCQRKYVWDDVVRTFVPLILDISVIEWEEQNEESVTKLRDALYLEFEFIGVEFSRQGFRNAIKRFL